MTRFRASWVVPIDGPVIRDGWLAVDDGRITAVGHEPPPDAIDLGHVALMPGLVNAHTHLELSHLHGQIPRGATFMAWVQTLLRVRREQPAADAQILAAAAGAVAQARASGTALVGDVANTPVTIDVLRQAGMAGRVFIELIGFAAGDPQARVRETRAAFPPASNADVRVSLAAHAPYSVSPALFTAIRQDLDTTPDARASVHVAESPEEVEFIECGTGPWRVMLERLGVWNPEWRAPGCSTVSYLDRLGFLDSRVLAVHGVQCSGEDLRRLQVLGVAIAACPRSNAYVGVGSPPLEAFYAMDVEVAFGTDSLASNDNLHMFDELREARRLAPRVPASALLRSATLVGAKALGFEGEFGALAPGYRAEVLAVRVPEGVTDVEEYLVGGVSADDLTWVGHPV